MTKPPSSPSRKPFWSCRVSAGTTNPPSLAGNVENLSLDDAIGKRLEGRKIRLLSIAIQLYALSAGDEFLPLSTPWDDQKAVVSYARDHGCSERNIRVMREDSEDEAMRPTRDNIVSIVSIECRQYPEPPSSSYARSTRSLRDQGRTIFSSSTVRIVSLRDGIIADVVQTRVTEPKFLLGAIQSKTA